MNLKNSQILICDDSALERRKIKNMLESHGVVTVFEACDGEGAIKQYETNKPDIVFMDIVMPGITGVEALEKIIEIDKDAKVIMASSVGTKGYINDAVKIGAVDFIQKPFEEEQIVDTLEKILGGQ